MPWDQVMHKFKKGDLKSGSGGKVTDRKQAIAIMLSEKKSKKKEYHIGPSDNVSKKHGVKS
jgi:hypothetical protein